MCAVSMSWLQVFVSWISVTLVSSSVLDFIDKQIKTGKYDKRLRPYSGGPSLSVKHQLYIISLGPIETTTFTFETEFYLRQWWTDPRIIFNASKTQLNSKIQPESIIWIPDLTIINARKVEFYHSAVRTVLKGDGTVYISQRLKAKCNCLMDLTYYPMDTQKCQITFESFAYSRSDMILSWHKTPVITDHIHTPAFSIESVEGTIKTMEFDIDNRKEIYDNLIVTFKVKRTFLYFVYRVYVPTILLMIFNFGSYWIPATAVPARVTLIVTTFLASTFILQSVSGETVKVSYTTPLQLFMLVSVVLVVVAIVEYMVVLFIKERHKKLRKKSEIETNAGYVEQKKSKTNKHVVQNVNAIVSGYPSQHAVTNGYRQKTVAPKTIQVMPKSTLSFKIDIVFRTVLPFFYVIFCCSYFTYYLIVV
ncbi:glycine receptor subunit alpha-3-like [Hydractinia symbiolongicarpus]|uniref:glycine receptor subunit alpha-3-like n=1 Tax=Hydractinia symbiolongicarpus TaxID=13093 RepID=UPI00254DEF6C|nr:glycine receptor subunit alpha-3-like [Hydractinia symbiolongicarpus]XP_057291822.1 glycine receptor subunit alpha-3-like [Hydractinia symbiolongicarpus]